jgi:hypothetical protein
MKRGSHVSRSFADVPSMQLDDAAGARLRKGWNDPVSCFRMREVPHRGDVDAGGAAERGSGAREKGPVPAAIVGSRRLASAKSNEL